MGKLIDADELKTKLMFDKRTANVYVRTIRLIFEIIDDMEDKNTINGSEIPNGYLDIFENHT